MNNSEHPLPFSCLILENEALKNKLDISGSDCKKKKKESCKVRPISLTRPSKKKNLDLLKNDVLVSLAPCRGELEAKAKEMTRHLLVV